MAASSARSTSSSNSDDLEYSDDSVSDGDYVPSSNSSFSSSSDQSTAEEPPDVQREVVVSPKKPAKTRERKRCPQSWYRNKVKRRRNSGYAYKPTGQIETKAAKSIGPACSCKKNCFRKVGDSIETLFNSFWDIGDFNQQNAYLFGCIQSTLKGRSYVRGKSRRSYTFHYRVRCMNTTTELCKVAFMSVHGLQNNRGRIRNIQKQVKEGAALPVVDGRGKHGNRPNKHSEESVQGVRDFLERIPKYQSHYSRKENPDKVYLDCSITIARLYRIHYKDFCRIEKKPIVSADKFRRIFCGEFNIGFKLPKSDTCPKCDGLDIKLKSCQPDEVEALNVEKELHLRKAEAGQAQIKALTNLAISNPSKYHVISLDLQQALPTPRLTVGPAFYKRKILTYNLGIHDCAKNKGYMMMWSEVTAGRGSEEICSALLKYLDVAEVSSEELHVITDNCRGQNKNWNVIAVFATLIQNGKFKKIEQHFPVVGHTYLPCDRDFGRIESFVRHHSPLIYSPHHWAEVVREANSREPFTVTLLETEDFKSIKPCSDSIVRKTITSDGRSLKFSEAISFCLSEEDIGYLHVRHSYCAGTRIEKVAIRRSGRQRVIDLKELPPKYLQPIGINPEKLRDVLSLLPWIIPTYHGFYESLADRGSQAVNNTRVTLVDGADDDSSNM